MNIVKCIALDLDGTTVNSQHRISERTCRAIQSCINLGIRIIPISGRSIKTMPIELQTFTFPFLIGSNGAIIQEKDQIIKQFHIVRFSGLRYIEQLEKLETSITICADGDMIKSNHCQELFSSFSSQRHKVIPEKTDDMIKMINERELNIEKISCRVLNENTVAQVMTLKEDFPDLKFLLSEQNYIEVISCETSKENALVYVLKRMNIDRKNVIAFGDGENDLGMLKLAGYSYAMMNASEKLKREADCITLSNDCDGVAIILEELIRKHSKNRE